MRSELQRRVIAASIRRYSPQWRSRHGEDATLLTEALLDDGVAWWSITLSMFGGALRERFLRKPCRRVGTTLVAAAIGLTAVPLVLVASLAPASASSANVVIVITRPDHAVRQLEAAFAAHHFRVTVTEQTAPARLVGSVLSVYTDEGTSDGTRVIGEIRGPCVTGSSHCVDGLVFPRHFSGSAHVAIGRAALLASSRDR